MASLVVSTYRQDVIDLAARMEADMRPVRERLDAVWQDVQVRASALDVDLPERPEAEADPPDEADWLLDTNRGYGEQLHHYHARKAGGNS